MVFVMVMSVPYVLDVFIGLEEDLIEKPPNFDRTERLTFSHLSQSLLIEMTVLNLKGFLGSNNESLILGLNSI